MDILITCLIQKKNRYYVFFLLVNNKKSFFFVPGRRYVSSTQRTAVHFDVMSLLIIFQSTIILCFSLFILNLHQPIQIALGLDILP